MGIWQVLRTPVRDLVRGAYRRYAAPGAPAFEEVAQSYPTYSSGRRSLASQEAWDPGLNYTHQRDETLRRKGFKNFERQRQDPQVRAVDSLIRYAVVSKGYTIAPPPKFKDHPEARFWADFLAYVVEDMKGTVADMSFKTLSAIGDGYSFSEKVYRRIAGGPYDGLIGYRAIKHKKPGSLDFVIDDYDNITALKSLVATSGLADLDPGKFVIYTWDGDYGNPYGRPVLVTTYKAHQVKDAVRKFWAVYLDKFGTPPTMVKYPRGADKATMTKVKEVLQFIINDTTFSVPDELEIEVLKVLEGAGRGNGSYEAAMRYCDAEIAKSFVGAALAVNENAKTGSRSQAQVHESTNGIFYAKVKTDLEEAIWFEQVIRPLMELNATLPVEMMPRLTFNPLEAQDMLTIAQKIELLIKNGVIDAKEPWIRDLVQVPANTMNDQDEGDPAGGPGDDLEEAPMQEFPVDPAEVPNEIFSLHELPSLILSPAWQTPGYATNGTNGNTIRRAG